MRAPEVAIGEGTLGFWAATRDIRPTTRAQRCWVHKIANALDKLPKSVQPRAKKMHDAMNAPTIAEYNKAIDDFVETYGAKYPKAAASLVDGRARLVTYQSFPQHGVDRKRTWSARHPA
jgi:transposase-like protein